MWGMFDVGGGFHVGDGFHAGDFDVKETRCRGIING